MLCMAALLMAAPALVFYVLLWKTAFRFPLADDYDMILKFVNVVSQSTGLSSKFLYAVTVEHNGYKLMLDNFITLTQYSIFGQVYFLPLVALGDSFALLIFLVTCSMSQVYSWRLSRKGFCFLSRRVSWFFSFNMLRHSILLPALCSSFL